ncbi:MAG: hypothetical protein WBG69_00315 [Arcobacteraceae bacterium]
MSLKEDVEYIKKEISAEESYIENFFKVEKIFKKYKKLIIATVVIIFVSVIGYYISSYITQKNTMQANIAFNALIKNPNDTEALAVLKAKNSKLYEIYQYKLDTSKKTDVEFFSELVQYTEAIKENSIEKITSVTQKQKFLLQDFALLNKAIIQAQNTQYSDAKDTLKLINDKSEVAPLSKMLEHFLLTK